MCPPHPLLVEKKSRDHEFLVTGKWRVIDGRSELTRCATPETLTYLPADTGESVSWHHGGSPNPQILNPGERIGDSYTITSLEGGRYRLDSQWTVLCGNSPKELAECKIRSNLEIEVPEGAYDAPPGTTIREK